MTEPRKVPYDDIAAFVADSKYFIRGEITNEGIAYVRAGVARDPEFWRNFVEAFRDNYGLGASLPRILKPPPDLQELVAFAGGYNKITEEMNRAWDNETQAWKMAMRADLIPIDAPRSYSEPYDHYCAVCGRWAAAGLGQTLRPGQVWHCTKHAPPFAA